MTTEELRILLDILKEYKIKEYKTAELQLTFDISAFYNPPKHETIVTENPYGETY